MKKSLYLSFFLAVVGALSALMITAVFDYAEPILIEREQALINESLSTIYRDMVEFQSVFEGYEFELSEDSTITNIYEIYSATELSGVVFETVKLGRNADIKMLIAYDLETKSIKEIVYLAQAETKGIGDRILSESYVDGIVGQSADSTEIDLLAGATYSSVAVKTMIEEASLMFSKVGDYNE